MGAAFAIMVAALVHLGPLAGAGHTGSPFAVEGTACWEELVGCRDARLDWSGTVSFQGTGTYRLTIFDPTLERMSPALTIRGRESFANLQASATPTCAWLETFEYRGTDADADGALFEVSGALSNCVVLADAYKGTLRGHFLGFDLFLPFPFPDPQVP